MTHNWTDKEKARICALKKEGTTYRNIVELVKVEFGFDTSVDSVRNIVFNDKGRELEASEVKLVFVYGDTHHDFHDQNALDMALEIAKHFNPHVIIDNGDGCDCYEVSAFCKTKPDPPKLKAQLESKKEQLKLWRETFPNAKYIYNEGNHDWRILSYIAKHAPAFLGFAESRIDGLLGLEELGIVFNPAVNKESEYDLGKIIVGHWDRVRKQSAYTAKSLVEDMGVSLIQGHTHRLGSHFKTQAKHQLVGYEGGCLCDLHATYKKHVDWQQGVCTITIFPGGEFQVQQIPIVQTEEGRMFAIFGDKIHERKIEAKGA